MTASDRCGEAQASAARYSMLNCLAGLLPCTGGVDGAEPLYLPQDPPPPCALTVFESVLLARQRGVGGLRVSAAVRRDVRRVLVDLGLADVGGRTLAQLSGGQRQLVGFAQAVVRDPDVVLLDEPTSSLDLHNQLLLLGRVRDYVRRRPAAAVIVLHDIGHAARFADTVVVLRDGVVHAVGPPAEVITADMLAAVYRVDAAVHSTADGGLAITVSSALRG